jgi:hypothetical protein
VAAGENDGGNEHKWKDFGEASKFWSILIIFHLTRCDKVIALLCVRSTMAGCQLTAALLWWLMWKWWISSQLLPDGWLPKLFCNGGFCKKAVWNLV